MCVFFHCHGKIKLLLCTTGKAVGLRAVHRGKRGAGHNESPNGARDSESERALEAGHGGSAGGPKAGEQPGSLRGCCWY